MIRFIPVDSQSHRPDERKLGIEDIAGGDAPVVVHFYTSS